MREAYAEQLLEVITDDARVVSAHSVTLLLLGTFIAITIASTTDKILMHGKNMIELPLLNVEVPTSGTPGSFYVVAPVMILALHCAVLLLLSLLGFRLERFQEVIKDLSSEQRGRLCTRLPSFYCIQFLEGEPPREPLRTVSHLLLGLTIVLPLGLLLWTQVRLLPMHSVWLTLFHMSIVVVDAGLVCWLWPHLPGRHNRLRVSAGWWYRTLHTLAHPLPRLCVFVILLSILPPLAVVVMPEQKATIDFYMGIVIVEIGLMFWLWPYLPGYRHRPCGPSVWWRQTLQIFAYFLAYFLPRVGALFLLFNVLLVLLAVGIRSEQTTGTDLWGNLWYKTNTLVTTTWYDVRDLNLQEKVLTVDALPPEVINALRDGLINQREDALNKISPLTFQQGRDLRHANFFNAVLPRLDLRGGTRLEGANLHWTQMQQVLLDEANLQGANLEQAGVQEGSLQKVHMQGANLKEARLQVANLTGAQLQGVCACEAKFNGAVLSGAELARATLKKADLRGANLQGANLREANLFNADLQGADLSNADLRYAILRGARLQGAVLRDVYIVDTDFRGAEFDLADISAFSIERIHRTRDPRCSCRVPEFEELDDITSPIHFEPPIEDTNPFVRANSWRCRQNQADQFQHCTPIADYDYQKLLTQRLGELACADPYVARGLSEQVLHARRADRCLAKVLLALECPNVQLLPERVKRALKDAVNDLGLRVCISDSPNSSP